MLKTAVTAQFPLIAVNTRDPINAPFVVAHLLGRKLVTSLAPSNPALAGNHLLDIKEIPSHIADNAVYVMVQPKKTSGKVQADYDSVRPRFLKHESTLILVNVWDVTPGMFDAGVLPVPRSLLQAHMAHVAGSAKAAAALVKALGGCTIKEAEEFAGLTMARDKSLTPQGIVKTRRSVFLPDAGLTLVDSQQAFYEPFPTLAEWVTKERPFFLEAKDDRLVPRGLLFDGHPGTGKTAGAKYIAEQWGVPLYRIDLGGVKNKYIGNSEANMLTNLQRIDQEAPCVVLFDEVEKVIGDQHDHGTTSTLLSQMLWWLAEHSSRVLTVMTTNAKTKLPPELYRERRIDRVMDFVGLTQGQAVPFLEHAFKSFPDVAFAKGAAHAIAEKVMRGKPTVSQARLIEAIIEQVKSAAKE